MRVRSSMLIVIVIPIILFAAACLMLEIALRGSRVDRHPVCRKCGFDLWGLEGIGAGGAAVACPECGTDVSALRSVRFGNRKRRRGSVAVALVMVAMTAGLAGMVYLGLAMQFNWAMVLPTPALLSEMESASITRRDGAIVELLRRMDKQKLSGEQASVLAERVIEIQADRRLAWTTVCGEALERVWEEKVLSEGQKEAVMRNSATFELIARDAVKDRLGVVLNMRPDRVGPSFVLWDRFPRLKSAAIDGRDLVPLPVEATGRIVYMSMGQASIGHTFLLDVEPGEHDVALRWEIHVGSRDGSTATWEEEFTRRIAVRRELALDRITDPGLREAVKESIEASLVRHDVAAGTLTSSVEVRNPPCNLAFEAFFIVGSRRIFAGKVLARDDHRASSIRLVGSVGEFTVGDRVGLALEASEVAAESDPVMGSYWGEDVEFEGLEVVRDGG